MFRKREYFWWPMEWRDKLGREEEAKLIPDHLESTSCSPFWNGIRFVLQHDWRLTLKGTQFFSCSAFSKWVSRQKSHLRYNGKLKSSWIFPHCGRFMEVRALERFPLLILIFVEFLLCPDLPWTPFFSWQQTKQSDKGFVAPKEEERRVWGLFSFVPMVKSNEVVLLLVWSRVTTWDHICPQCPAAFISRVQADNKAAR